MPNLVPVSLSLWAGIYQVLFAFTLGVPVVLMEQFSAAEFARLVREHGIRSSVLPPAAMVMLLQDPSVASLEPLRYVRSVPNRPLTGAVTTARLAGSVSIDRLSLGGGLAARQSLEPLGLDGTIEFMAARRKLHARVLFHEIGSRRITFEIVDISLDDRWRLRRMLVDEAHVAADEPHSETAAEPEPLAPAPPD